jgi:hypothetical protein
LAAAIVSWFPASVPKVPVGFPDAAALASVQFADVMVKFVASVSVILTWVPSVVTRIGDATVG